MITAIEDQNFRGPAPSRLKPLLLVEEISHRVVNEYAQAIAAIRLAAAQAASTEARVALADAASRLLQFANAHRALQGPADRDQARDVNLSERLEDLCIALSSASLRERGVRLSLMTETVHLPAERCWRVALIVSELITNAARHGLRGSPGDILVELEQVEAEVVCRVTDSGVADHQRPDPRAGRGLGIVRALAGELSGEVLWRFSPGGACAQLTFPNDPPDRFA